MPPTPVQELRALTRTRKQLVRERASHVQRVDKLLQDANIILTAVYVMLGRGVDYVDLTAGHFVRTDRTKIARRLLRRLGDLGYDVLTVRAPEAAA